MTRSRDRPRTSVELGPRHALLVFGAYVAAQLFVGMGAGVYAEMAGGDADVRLGEVMGIVIPLAVLAAGWAVWLLFRQFERRSAAGPPLRSRIGWRRVSPPAIVVAAVAGVGLGLGLIAFTFVVPFPENPPLGPLARAAATEGLSQVGWAFAAVVLAPPIEEFVFRGVLFEGFRQRWGTWIGGAVVTVLVLVMHLAEAWFYWPAIVGLSVAAVLLLVLRVRTGSLLPPIALHFAYNLTLAAATLWGA